MAFNAVVLCIFAFLGQSFAQSCYRKTIATPNSGYANQVSVSKIEAGAPVYSNEGSGISEDYQTSYKPSISGSPVVSSPILVSENGGAFLVTSYSPIAPAGIAVATDLGLAGELVLSGELPYLSAVAFEGQFDASGSAPVSYGCGDGCITITEQIGNAGALSSSRSEFGCGKT